jgi:CBS domain containing-hemolysin-like protein
VTDVILLYSLLLAVSTLLSLFEVSILTINSRNLELLSQERAYLAFFEKRKDSAASLIMITNFLVDYVGAMILSALLISELGGESWLYLTATCATSLLTLWIATLAAKLFASKKPELIIKNCGMMIICTYWILKPFVSVISAPVLYLMRGVLSNKDVEKLSDSELLSVLSIAKKEGLIRASQHKFMERLISLQNKTVGDIIPQNQEIESVDINTPITELSRKLTSRCHKRLVVTKMHNDKHYPIGILMFADIVKINYEYITNKMNGGEELAIPLISEVMKPCVATSISTSAEVLVDKLDHGENHIVVVIDDEGVMRGIIQSDDIIHSLTVI